MNLNCRLKVAAVALLTILMGGEAANAQQLTPVSKKDKIFIDYEFSKKKFYEQEGAFITLWLYSVNPDIAFAKEAEAPTLNKGNFAYASKVQDMRQSKKERVKGVDYYAYPLSTYLVMMRDPGKFKLQNGSYEVGINVPVVYQDPMWGEQRGFETRSFRISLPTAEFRVKELPVAEGTGNFSGAVGNFEIVTSIPEGNIILNEPSTVVITVRGNGLIGNDILPEYREAFGNGTKLRSVSENSRMFFDGKDVVSELELECEFIPTDKDNCEIGIVSLGYFNPETEKYETARSEPVRVNVKSLSVERSVHDI